MTIQEERALKIVHYLDASGVNLNEVATVSNGWKWAVQTSKKTIGVKENGNHSNNDLQDPVASAFSSLIEHCDNGLIMGMLVKANSPNIDLGKGQTPLHLAVQFRRELTIKVLLLHGAATDRINNEGLSALDLAKKIDNQSAVLMIKRAQNNSNNQPQRDVSAPQHRYHPYLSP